MMRFLSGLRQSKISSQAIAKCKHHFFDIHRMFIGPVFYGSFFYENNQSLVLVVDVGG